MMLRDAVKKVRQGDMRPCTVVLHGDEQYIRATGIRELTRAAGVQAPEMNIAEFEGRPDMSRLVEALARFPFMSESKVVILKDTDLLSAAVQSTLTKPLENAVIEEHTLFIITAPGKLDKRKGYVKKLMSSALLVECKPLVGEALSRFVVSEAKRRNLHIGKQAAAQLIERTQGDLYALASELDKLASVAEGQITPQDVQKYTPPSLELNMFGILDTYAAGKHEQGFAELMRLLQEDPSPVGFLTFLANTFRQMLVARACRDARFPEHRTLECVCAETGAKEWTARRAYERAARFSAAHLRRNVQLMANVDFGLKQGEFFPESDMYGLMERLFTV